MAYEEYDYYNEPAGEGKSLKESLREILNGLNNEKNWRETSEGLKRIRDIIPNVSESLARGGVAQAIGTSGDLRDLRNTINSYLPKSVRNFTQAAEFLANPYATAIQQTAPTTEETLDFVPRATDTYEGYKQHETLGEYIAPSLGYFAGKGVKALKDLPVGASIIGPESKLWKDATEGVSLENRAFKASTMEAKGKQADEILKETGMVRGLDNQWRSEITDFWSTIKGDKPFGELHKEKALNNADVKVKDIFEHPELFRHYPELGEINIRPHAATEPYKGEYSEAGKYITLREDLSPEEARSVLHHELTHGTQGIENWNRGGNISAMDTWSKLEANRRMTALNKELDVVWAEKTARQKAGLPVDDLRAKELDLIDQRNKAFDFGMQDPVNLYKRLGGEAEARMVQERLGLTQDQMREIFPYAEGKYGLDINPDEAITAGYEPGVINVPSQSANLPKASVEVKGIPQSEVDELGFHSPLETAILKIGQPKGTGDQFLKQLEKMPGVKTEELEVSGVKKYLQDHPTVTKQELQDYIAKNRVAIENKVLTEEKSIANNEADYELQGGDVYHDQDYIDSTAEDLRYQLENDADIWHQEQETLVKEYPELYEGHELDPNVAARLNKHVEERIAELADTQAKEMYYDNPIRHYYDDYGYDIYGNDDMGYSIKDPTGRFLDIGDHYDIHDLTHELRMHHLDNDILDFMGNEEGVAKYEDYTLPGKYQNYREILTTIPENISGEIRGNKRFNELSRTIGQLKATPEEHKEFGKLVDLGKSEDYTNSHYDEPNILAHMRVNDRMINGKKTLMVEEIQSDWHQAGRKEGYEKHNAREIKADINQKMGYLHKDKMKLRDQYDQARKEDNIDAQNELSRQIAEIEKQQVALQTELNKVGTVPDAPFKKNWHEMMVKQALDMAAKGDYDAIAFTTGRQQVERYENSLRKAVDEINFNKRDDNTISIYAMKGGRETFAGIVKDGKFIDGPGQGKTIEEVLGKGIAKQINEGELFKPGTIRGKDLTIGGEGMKGFYDKIIPDFINKYGKKWGMGMKKANLDAYGQGLSTHQIEEGIKNLGYTMDEYLSKTPSEKMEIFNKIAGEEIHFVELTDAAKKEIKTKGQPMFSGIGLAAPALMPEDQDKRKK